MVQDFTSDSRFRFLVFDEPVFQSATKNRHFTEQRRRNTTSFYQRPAVITDATLPNSTTVFANRIVVLKPRLFAVISAGFTDRVRTIREWLSFLFVNTNRSQGKNKKRKRDSGVKSSIIL